MFYKRTSLSSLNILTLFKSITIILWLGLFLLLLKRDYMIESLESKEIQALTRSNEVSFLGVYFGNDKIGYVENRITPTANDSVLLNQEAFLLLNILNQHHSVKLTGKATLGKGYLVETFSFRLEAPFYEMNVHGTVQDNIVNLTMNTGKQEIKDQIKLKSPPFLSTNHRSYLLNRSLTPNDKIRIPYFDPFTLSVQDTIVEYKGKEKTLIQGRIYNLHRFSQNHAGIRVNSWLNDKGKVIKEESPAGFIFIAEPEFKAKALSNAPTEILSTVSIKFTGSAPNLEERTTMQYRLTLPDDANFVLSKDRQSLIDNIITIRLETLPDRPALICKDQEQNLAATPYVQSENEQIKSLIKALDIENYSPLSKVQTIAEWVFTNLEKKPVIGIPDAVTTLANKRGDCNEHAALFAALARSAGIPARITAGVTLHQGAFYYHAWNEVCLEDSWFSLDTTKNQLPADLGHIKFIEGETQEQMKIGALLGRLKIEIMDLK